MIEQKIVQCRVAATVADSDDFCPDLDPDPAFQII
jgi:hypothetical protein